MSKKQKQTNEANRMRAWMHAILFALTISFLFPALVMAQASIVGVVKDPSGGVLPGVTVEASSPALIEKVRTVLTDGAGAYKIVALRPGTYSVTFMLSGFNTVKREGIELAGSFAAEVNAELKVGAVSETITVTGESPLVDVQNTKEERVLDRDVLDAIPAGRSHLDYAVLVPGIATSQGTTRGTLMDVGGTNNLQNTTMTIHDNRSTDTRLMFDGLRLGNIASQGQYTNFVPDTGSTQEIAIDYASLTAEEATGGLKLVIVPREGGNRFTSTLFGTAVTSWFENGNVTQALENAGLGTPNSIKDSYDFNGSVGGPIMRDNVWFYSSVRAQDNEAYVAGVYPNLNAGNPNAWSYLPNYSGRDVFFILQKSVNGRLTWQANQKNKFSFYFEDQSRVWDDNRAGIAPEAGTRWRFPALRLAMVTWSSPISNRLLLDVRYSSHAEVYNDQTIPGGDPLIPVTEQGGLIPGLLYRGRGTASLTSAGGAFPSINMPNLQTVGTSLTYVTGSHALKVGFVDFWGTNTTTSTDNDASVSYQFNNGVPNLITERASPITVANTLAAELGAYVQDRWTIHRLTLQGGLRFDHTSSYFPAETLGPGPLVPTRNLTFPQTQAFNLSDLTPRVGAAYDLFGDGKTAFKVALGKYIIPSNSAANLNNPALALANSVTRAWNDSSPVGSPQYYMPQCDLLNPQANGDCGKISNLNFGNTVPTTTYDPATLSGWGHSGYNWEFETSVQHQLLPRVSANFGYFRRWYGNFLLTDNQAVAPTDFSPFCVTAPLNPGLSGGGGNQVCGLYNVNPNKVGVVNNYVTFANNFGSQIEHYNGVDASVNIRLPGTVTVQGGLSTGSIMTDDCSIVGTYLATVTLANTIGTVQSTQMCHLSTPFWQPQVKFLGTFTVPRIDVRFAATLQSLAGLPLAANYVATNAVVAPSLGRPLSGGAANTTVNLVAPGTLYEPRVNEFDVRFTKILGFGRIRSTVNFDIYNVLNLSTVTLENLNFVGTGSAWQTPQSILNGRLFKISAQFNF